MRLERHRTLWELTRGQRLRYAAAILAMGLSNVFVFGAPLVSKSAIDGILGGEDAFFSRLADAVGAGGALWLAASVILGLTILGGVFQYLRGRWAAIASEEIVRGLRDRLLAHLERLPCAYHDRADTGDLVQRCTSDVETVRVFLAAQVVEIGRAVLLLVTVIPVMLWLDVRMTFVALALFPVIIVFAVVFFRRIQDCFLASDEAEGEMTTVLQENLTGIRVVRAFARQDFEDEKFATKNALFRDRTRRLLDLLATYWSISDLLCLGQIGLTLVAGAWWTWQGAISVGTLFAFATYENIVMWPVRHLGRVLADTGKALVALDRLREILEVPEESGADPAAPSGNGRAARLRGGIELDGVRFGYDGESDVLRDVSLSIEPGGSLALLGPPGAGKSTIVQLLLRLYDYDRGSIRLDGKELAELPRRFVRSQIGVVLQEPFLYSKTLAANVGVGRREATREEIVESTQAACIHGAIEEFEHGYDTLVGERGVTLSGGQRQRVALARALVKDPPILVLDDALSAVDTGTESRILAELERRRGRATTILIAHRLSSVRHADRIVVLEEGRVVQAGTHEELLGAEGMYRRLWRIQGAVEDEIEEDLGSVRGAAS